MAGPNVSFVQRFHQNQISISVFMYSCILSDYMFAHILGSGLERGGIITEIINSKTTPIQVVLLEMVPWYLRILLHTMKVECTQQTDREIIKECDNNTGILLARNNTRPSTNT